MVKHCILFFFLLVFLQPTVGFPKYPWVD